MDTSTRNQHILASDLWYFLSSGKPLSDAQTRHVYLCPECQAAARLVNTSESYDEFVASVDRLQRKAS